MATYKLRSGGGGDVQCGCDQQPSHNVCCTELLQPPMTDFFNLMSSSAQYMATPEECALRCRSTFVTNLHKAAAQSPCVYFAFVDHENRCSRPPARPQNFGEDPSIPSLNRAFAKRTKDAHSVVFGRGGCDRNGRVVGLAGEEDGW